MQVAMGAPGAMGPIKGNQAAFAIQNNQGPSGGVGKQRSYSKQVHPNKNIDLMDNNGHLDVSIQSINARAKSNAINKTPELKSQFRKNDALAG